MIFTQQHAEELQASLKTQGEGIQVRLSTLDGENRSSLMILICLDKKETWANKIMENSRYARFTVCSTDNKLEMFSGGYKLPKFRKAKIKDMADLTKKLQGWIDKAENTQEIS